MNVNLYCDVPLGVKDLSSFWWNTIVPTTPTTEGWVRLRIALEVPDEILVPRADFVIPGRATVAG